MPSASPLIWRVALLSVVVASIGAVAAPRAQGTTLSNLVVGAVSDPPASMRVGRSFSVTDTTKNAGSGRAAPSATAYFLSLDTRWSSSDIPVANTRSVPGLKPAASSTGTVRVNVGLSTPTGTFHLLACADARKAVTESNESDNCRAASGTVKLLPHPLNVGPVLEPTHATTQIVSITGGVIEATAADGTTLSLSIPNQALFSPQQVTLTPIRSLSGSPATAPVIAGAEIDPPGLHLVQAATLTVGPPRSVPLSNQHGFAYGANGHQFHRTPLGLSTTWDPLESTCRHASLSIL